MSVIKKFKAYFRFTIVFFVLILLFGILLMFNNETSKDKSLDDSMAAGFGVNAIRERFKVVDDAFKALKCDNILNVVDLGNYELHSIDEENFDTLHKSCSYFFKVKDTENFRLVNLSVFPYSLDSYIDANEEELFYRIADQLNIEVLSGFPKKYSNNTYFYGQYNDGFQYNCVSLIFNPINDFEYASVVLYGEDGLKCFDNATVDIVETIAKKFIDTINEVMTEVELRYPLGM